MSDETAETDERQPSFFATLLRKLSFVLGVFVLIWLLLAKNLPNLFSPHTPTAPPAPKIHSEAPAAVAVDTDEVAALRQRLEKLEAAGANPSAVASEKVLLAPMEDQMAKIARDMADLQVQLDESVKQRAALEEKLMQLKSQLDALQDGNARELTAITSFSLLKETIMRGEPFTPELKQVAGLLHGDDRKALLAPLEPLAASGIVTLPVLQTRFGEALNEALAPKGDSFGGNLRSLIRIRKEGEQQQGADDESVLARAEAKVGRGEIAAALKELQALSPAAAEAMDGWMRDAQHTIDVRSALDALQLALLKPEPETGGQ